MVETIKIVTKCELVFDVEYAVDKMFEPLIDDLKVSTNEQYDCIDDLPTETKEHLRDEILKEVLTRFEIF